MNNTITSSISRETQPPIQLTQRVQLFHAKKWKKQQQQPPNSISISISIERNFAFRLLSVSTRKSMAIEPIMKATDASAPLILTSGASGRINALFSVRAFKSLVMLMTSFMFLLLVPFRRQKRANSILASAEKPKDNEKQESGSGGGGGSSSSQRKGAVVRIPATFVLWRRAAAAAADQEVAARRAIAIQRVVQDDGDDRVLRDFSLFVTTRGDTIFTQSWTPVSIKIRGLVVLMHGLNEHSGRYNDFAKRLNANGYKVYGMDWIDHKLSPSACLIMLS